MRSQSIMAKTLALTGGTGFVGRHLIRHFLARGWTVRALARRPRGLEPAPNLDLIEGSLEDSESLEVLIEGADVTVMGQGYGESSPHAERQGFGKPTVE